MQNCAISKFDIFYVCDFRSTSVPVEVTVTPLGTRPPVIDAAVFTISVSEAVPIGSSLWTVPVCNHLYRKKIIFNIRCFMNSSQLYHDFQTIYRGDNNTEIWSI